MAPILKVEDLNVVFNTYRGKIQAVNDISFSLNKGEILGIVGESGSGKSVTANAIMGLIAKPHGEIVSGKIIFEDRDITKLSEKELQKLRGSKISMIFQDPMTSLNPVLTIGLQISEMYTVHQGLTKKAAIKKTLEILDLVGISDPQLRLQQYPHQMSGGMRQRVMISMALACKPRILIADEPTTALDVTIQAQIIELLKTINQQLFTTIILITHDLGVIANLCQNVLVMYAGNIIEASSVEDLFNSPLHPYSWGLLKSVPHLDEKNPILYSIKGQPPDLLNMPAGCSFMPRCQYAMKICNQPPPLFTIASTHYSRCWLVHEASPYQLTKEFKNL